MQNDPSSHPEWKALEALQRDLSQVSLNTFFADDPARFDRYHVTLSDGLLYDYSKTHVNDDVIAGFAALAGAQEFEDKRAALFSGGILNDTEGRAAHHTALRENPPSVPYVAETLEQIKAVSDDIRGNADITDVLCLGIGGSFLGPYFVCDALQDSADGPQIHFLANIDGASLSRILSKLSPKQTAVIIASKTFSTLETLTNAQAVKAWGDLSLFYATTGNRQGALDFGIAEDHILALKSWIGGRYSVWSAIGLPIALSLGFDAFQDFLAGANIVDHHFYDTPLTRNIPFLMGSIGVWYRNFWNYPAHAILPYANAFTHFPAYLQQLDMESNGKHATIDTSAIVFGGVGTNSQHSFMQHLHQSTTITPVDFILFARAEHTYDDHHNKLVSNALAQSQALMSGLENTDEPHRHFEGNRPSSALILDQLTPQTIGIMMALYEHKTFVQGVLWGINSFDQWGVELGKSLSRPILEALQKQEVVQKADSSTRSLIDYIQQKNT